MNAHRLPRWTSALLTGVLLGSTFQSAMADQRAAPSLTRFSFGLPHAATTSAGVYDTQGRLVRTLWRGEPMPAGTSTRYWDGLDDAGQPRPAAAFEIRLIHHTLRYRWEGVIGNSSATIDRAQVHRAFLPPTSIAIAGEQAHYAVGYNERQSGIQGFRLAEPGLNNRPIDLVDPFAAVSMVATDGQRLYWANTGGLSHTSFVGMVDAVRKQPAAFPSGRDVCLNRRPGSNACYEDQDHRGVIDVQTDTRSAPTGLAVQEQGPLLAVAHGGLNRVDLFDKLSGARLGGFTVALAATGLNQLAMTHNGDLWVVADKTALRYTDLATHPRLAATLTGLVQPLAVAVSPRRDDTLWVADGGTSQQLKRYEHGSQVAVIGSAGGYRVDPAVSTTRLCFTLRPGLEQTALAVAADESLWVVDTCNNRMLRFRADGRSDAQVAYLPALYASTVDHGQPTRVFANYLEFEVDGKTPLVPGGSWRLARNWLGGLPASLRNDDAFNAAFGGFRSVETLANARTYGIVAAQGRQVVVELPATGPLRVVKTLAAPPQGSTPKVLYENGDLGYAVTAAGVQAVMRLPLTGFDSEGNPLWASEPQRLASVPVRPGSPAYRGAFSGTLGPRFPMTSSGAVIFFDASVAGNEGFHLGAAQRGTGDWLWQASPSGPMDTRGTFQTRAVDGSITYGGNTVWSHGRHVVYGFHGEFYKDLRNQQVGQANQFMHFHDDGLFIGQFGVPSTGPAGPGISGNAFSPTLVRDGEALYLYHNDESSQGGVHRWRFDGWQGVQELKGSGPPGGAITLQ